MGKLLSTTIQSIRPLDKTTMDKVNERLNTLTKPPGSLGILEDLVVKLGGITSSLYPQTDDKVIIIMAGDHGVVEEKVSAFPSEVTPQMVLNFLNGGAAINVLCKHAGARILCVDIGVASDIPILDERLIIKKVKYGTDNMTTGPSMTRDEAIRAIEIGIEVVEEQIRSGAQLLGTGEMGIGNTTPSSAILAVYSQLSLENLVGRGTGVDDKRLEYKKDAITRAIEVNKPLIEDPIDILSKVGGLEIAGLTGCILGAAQNRKPIVIDGFISTAAALIASKIHPGAVDYMIASHVSHEPGHMEMLRLLGLKPMLHMEMRLGEGTGAALAFNLIDASVKLLKEMATFSEAGVSNSIGD